MKKENYLTEKDSLTDILTGEKDLVKLYSTAMTEATGKDVRKTLKNNMFETAEDQYSVFCAMQKNGYYQPKPADKTVIDEKKENFSSCLKQGEKSGGKGK